MKPKTLMIVGVIAVSVVGFYLYSVDGVKTDETKSEMTKKVEMADNLGSEKVGSYVSYSADKIAIAETGDVVLFFHASWCPTCSALNKDIEMSLKDIPSGVTILKTDYDKETELKKKYGVTYQHTLVQVDAKGNMIKKWSGGLKLRNLLSEIL